MIRLRSLLAIIPSVAILSQFAFPQVSPLDPKYSVGHRKPLVGSTVSIIVSGGTVVTMDKDRRVIVDGAVAIDGDEIVAVGKRGEITKEFRARRTINAAGKVIIP